MPETPHYLREYRRLLGNLTKSHSRDDAMALAVGGNYEGQGKLQADLILDNAPAGAFRVLDVGCGSGRAAYALRGEERLNYFGVDILPELLDYAKEKTARPDWRFEPITEIALPVEDGWADIVMFMSVFTHLTRREIDTYLLEAYRALKPGGKIIASYLDRAFPPHKKQFRPAPLQWLGRALGRDVMLSFTTAPEFTAQLQAAGFSLERNITYDTARQHVMIARKGSGAHDA